MSDFAALEEQFADNPDVKSGKWFGKHGLMVNGKCFLSQHGEDVAFKLTGDAHSQALEIEGARLFDPRGNGRAFKEWVHVPKAQSAHWSKLAEQAMAYVRSLQK